MDKNVLKDILQKKETRIYYLEHDFFTRCIYYFSKSFHYPKVAEFHRERCKASQKWLNIYLEWFRESAKTMLIWLLYDIWCIVYKKKRFICAFSYEWRSSSNYLFNIALELQTNQKLIEDYWQLFFSDNKEKKSQKKSINEFITENDIKLKAFSMWMSMRWQIFNSRDWIIRPDSLVFDDIDVIGSVRNTNTIENNYRFLKDEVFGWLSDYCQIRVLGNVIMEDWLNPRIREEYKNNSTRKIFSQWIYDKEWNITWERFVSTDKEAEEYNKNITDPKSKRISLESKLRSLWEISFNQNFLWKTYSIWDKLIKQSDIKWYEEDRNFDYIEIGIDPAFSEKTKTDELSITVTWFQKIEWTIYKYVEENISLIWEDKNESNVLKTVLSLYIQYKARIVKWESNNGWELYNQLCKNPSRMWWHNISSESIASTKDKFTRLKEYEWAFQRWEVYFRKWKTEKLVAQLLDFTWESWKKDDRVDSMTISFTNAWTWFYFSVI